MGWKSAANEEIENAEGYVTDAIKALTRVCVEECSGTDELEDGYRETVEECFNSLREIRRKLKG